jgi:aspartate/methionine/tyrosine aminotransferase
MHHTPSASIFVENARMAAVQSPVIPIVADLIRAHPGTISLGQGVVGYGPPPQAIDRLRDFLADADNHKYQAVYGIPPLLELYKQKLAVENGVTVGPERALVVTAGANMGFVNAVLATTDPGDEIIITSPYYFNHEMAIAMLSARPVVVPTDSCYQLRLDALAAAITPRTRAIVTISPNNPTGAVFAEGDLRAVNALCRQRGIYHISDEAYECFTWDGARHFSPAAIPESQQHTIALYSLSKSHGFASWRIGFMVAPKHLFEPIRKIQDTNLICPTVISQWAAVGALEAGADYCRSKLADIGEARRLMLDA